MFVCVDSLNNDSFFHYEDFVSSNSKCPVIYRASFPCSRTECSLLTDLQKPVYGH